jgi:hypothetical protein
MKPKPEHKPHPLSPKMIEALTEAIEKQKNNIPFGPDNIKGSLIRLIARGLIVREKKTINEHNAFQWHVTDEAIALMNSLGVTA